MSTLRVVVLQNDGLLFLLLSMGNEHGATVTLGYLVSWSASWYVCSKSWSIMHFIAYWVMVGLDELRLPKAANWVCINWVMPIDGRRAREGQV